MARQPVRTTPYKVPFNTQQLCEGESVIHIPTLFRDSELIDQLTSLLSDGFGLHEADVDVIFAHMEQLGLARFLAEHMTRYRIPRGRQNDDDLLTDDVDDNDYFNQNCPL